MRGRRRRAAMAVCALLVMAGCSDPPSYNAPPVEPGDVPQDAALRDSATSTTTTATETKPAVRKAVSTTTAAPRTTTTRPAVVIKPVEIGLYSDTSGRQAIEPSQALAKKGGIIRFTNHDPVEARSVVSEKGRFSSGDLAPGATYELKVSLPPGTYQYHDGTRPYANAFFKVMS